jgi:hypothetical protein
VSNPDTPPDDLTTLRRELAHVSEQCRIAHTMAQSWKSRALAADKRCEALQKQLDRRTRTGAQEEEPPSPQEPLEAYEEFVLSMA